MPLDIKTTAERVRTLRTLAKELLTIAKSCNAVQAYHDGCTDYVARNENVNASMASIKASIDMVAAALTDLAAPENMAFQFEWAAGQGNIEEILVNSSFNNVSLIGKYAGTDVPSAFYNALSAGDVIRIQGSTLNSGTYLVQSVANHAIAYVGGLGGTESLLARVIKELD